MIFLAYKQTRNIDIQYYDNKEIHTKQNIVFGCVVRSEHRIVILNEKSSEKEHLNVFITEGFIKKRGGRGQVSPQTTEQVNLDVAECRFFKKGAKGHRINICQLFSSYTFFPLVKQKTVMHL